MYVALVWRSYADVMWIVCFVVDCVLCIAVGGLDGNCVGRSLWMWACAFVIASEWSSLWMMN